MQPFRKKEPDALRRAELAKIHCAAKAMGLDDETYRAMLLKITGKDSSAKLDARQRGAVLDELRRLGFRSPATLDPNQRPGEPQERLALALWRDLAELGVLDDPSQAGLRRFAKRTCGIDSLHWADALAMNKVIEGLKAWRAREHARAVAVEQ